jgi:hypothetical protein
MLHFSTLIRTLHYCTTPFLPTYHERLSVVRKMMNESNASIVRVLLRPPGFRPIEVATAARTIHQSEIQPLILVKKLTAILSSS